jgi:hypothetical protein
MGASAPLSSPMLSYYFNKLQITSTSNIIFLCLLKKIEMKGISFVTNEKNEKIAVQIDLKAIEKHHEAIEDLLDGIIAESRKDEEKIPLSKVISKLKKSGKL